MEVDESGESQNPITIDSTAQSELSKPSDSVSADAQPTLTVEDVTDPEHPEIEQPIETDNQNTGREAQGAEPVEVVIDPPESVDDEAQDPNTSVTLNPPSSIQNFATPLKSLPALKDIEPITTPKTFNVLKDKEEVRSSPVAEQRSANLAELAEQDDALDHTANDTFASAIMETHNAENAPETNNEHGSDLDHVASFLGMDPASLSQIPSFIISRLVSKTQQFHGLQSELSFFKLNQEQLSHVQQKKLETFQAKIDKLTETNANITLENEVQYDELVTLKETLTAIRNENSSLAEKAQQSDRAVKEWEGKYNELLSTREVNDSHLNEALDKANKANLELGQKLSELNKELNEAINEKFTYKLEFNKAQNELVYTRNQKTWYEKELKDLQDRYTSLLKKNDSDSLRDSSLISSLSLKNETLTSSNESLRSQIKDLESKVEQQTNRASEIEMKMEIQASKIAKDNAQKDDLIELLNVQIREKDGRIETLETYVEDIKSTTSASISNLQKEIFEKDEKLASIEEKLRRTEEALDSELHKETELPKLGASAELIMLNKPQGISLSSLYTEFNHMKKELLLERSQKEKLAVELQHFVAELESKKPAIASYRSQILFYEQSLKDMLAKLEATRLDKLDSDKEVNRLRTRLSSFDSELQSLKQLSKDLGRQLCYYLIHSKVREGNENPLTAEERKTIDLILAKSGNKDSSGESDTDLLITERLVGFASIIELQQKNQELLVALRLLGKQLEAKEQETEGLESAAIEEAREAILTLQGELDSVNVKLEAVTKERDLMKNIGNATTILGNDNGKVEVKLLSEANQELKNRLKESEDALKALQTQSSEKIKSLMEKLSNLTAAYEEVQNKLSTAKHNAEIAESRSDSVRKLLDNANREIANAEKEISFWREQASKQESYLVKKSNELRDLEKKGSEMIASLESLKAEKEVWGAMQKSLKDEIAQLKRDRDQLSSFVSNLQSLCKEREKSSTELSNRLSQSIENYQSLQRKLSEKEERIEILYSQSEMALKAQNAKLEQVNEISERLAEAKQKITEKEEVIKTLRDQLANANKARINRTLENSTSLENGSSSADYDDIRLELKQAEAQITEFSNIAKAAEDALVKATESFDQYKVSADEKIEAFESEKKGLLSEIDNQKSEINDLRSQLNTSQSEHLETVQDLKTKLHEYSLKASSYDELKAEYDKKFTAMVEDLKSLSQANEALDQRLQSKCNEIELLSSELAQQKDANHDLLLRVEELTSQLNTATRELSTKESSISEEHSKKLEELESTKAKLNDLQYQLNLTLNQMELTKSGDATSGDSEESLKEVVNYLRREKDVAEAKANILQEDKQRLEISVDTLSAELSAVKSQLNRLLKTKVQLDDATKEHDRLLEQLEQLNILRESNMTLRSENKKSLALIETLKKEVEHLKSSSSSGAVSAGSNAGVDKSVYEQDVKLLKEENERLKNQLENNEEVKNLLARFEALKTEFRTKLIAHRDKNRELEKELNEVRKNFEQASKELGDLQSQKAPASKDNLAALKEQLEKAEASKAESDKRFEAEITKLKEQHESEIQNVKTFLKSQFDARLSTELSKAKAATAKEGALSDDAIKQKIDEELKARTEAATKALSAQFEKDLELKVQERVNERLATESSGGDVNKLREEITKEYESKIKELKDGFEQRLESERAKIEQSIETKYQFKLRVLNRKVEKLESEENAQTTGGEQAGQKASGASGRSTPTAQGPFGESTLSVIQPAFGNKNNGQQGQAFTQLQQQGQQQQNLKTQPQQAANQGNTFNRKRTFPHNSNTYKRPKEE